MIEEEEVTFKSMGVVDELCEACKTLQWHYPTPIQKEVIPLALEGRDIIGLAETGSGKTAAFAIPVIQALLKSTERDRGLFALVLVPTHELAEQVSNQFRALGSCIGLKCAVVVGGQDTNSQKIALLRKPHVVVATPGRLVDHMTNVKSFNFRKLQYLIMDEADRMLNANFEKDINIILTHIPQKRHSYLFSATMTNKVAELKRVSMTDPIKVEIEKEHLTVDKLLQYLVFAPAKFKDVYLVHLLKSLTGKSMIVFCETRANAHRVSLLLKYFDYPAVLLHGKLTQEKRTGSLNKFRSKDSTILVSTDVCSRGLDIPHVDVVINLDIPKSGVDYLHRVGRTARAGRAGSAYTFVTQYEVPQFKDIEDHINKNSKDSSQRIEMKKIEFNKSEVLELATAVESAQANAKLKMADDVKKTARKRSYKSGPAQKSKKQRHS